MKSAIVKSCDRLILVCVIIAAFIMPIERHHEGVKNIAVFLPLSLALVKYALERRNPLRVWRFTPVHYALFLYLGVCALTGVVSIAPQISLEFFRKELLAVLFLFVVITGEIREPRKIRWIVWAFLAGGLCAILYTTIGCFYSLEDKLVTHGRLSGTFRNPNRYAQYLLILSSLIVACFAMTKSKTWRAALGLFFLAALSHLFWTLSRAGWLALLPTMLVYSIACFSGKLGISRRYAIVPIAGVLILFGAVLARPRGYARITGGFIGDERLLIYRGGLKVFLAHPILGLGYGDEVFELSYGYDDDGKRIRYMPEEAKVAHSAAHNIFLQVAAETGAVGLVCFVLLHWLIFRGAWRAFRICQDPERCWLLLWGLSTFVAVFSIGQVHTLYRDRNLLIIWIVFGICHALQHNPAPPEDQSGRRHEWKPV
jgi:O-antigen ligase